MRGYVICSEHRSGSTLLCALLKSTAKLGRPREYFSDPAFCARVEREPQILDKIMAEATTPNGIYGLKVFTQQFDVTRASKWPQKLPGLRHIHLERQDLLGQAISLVRALQTHQFRSTEQARSEPQYDGRAIARHLARIADNHARWRRYFARNGIQPLWLTYEQLTANPDATVRAVAGHLGFDEDVAVDLASVPLSIQRDQLSEQWRSRFVLESADLNYLDMSFGKPRVLLRRMARDVGLFVRGARKNS